MKAKILAPALPPLYLSTFRDTTPISQDWAGLTEMSSGGHAGEGWAGQKQEALPPTQKLAHPEAACPQP